MNVCMYVCMYVCCDGMYECMYVCECVHIHIHNEYVSMCVSALVSVHVWALADLHYIRGDGAACHLLCGDAFLGCRWRTKSFFCLCCMWWTPSASPTRTRISLSSPGILSPCLLERTARWVPSFTRCPQRGIVVPCDFFCVCGRRESL